MKVTKAIEILSHHEIKLRTAQDHDFFGAVKLGIEALKRHRNRDYLTYNEVHELLPGESPGEEVS